MTKNAKLIYDIVNEAGEHPTAEDIYIKLKSMDKKVALATVYNNLHALCDKGLIRRVGAVDSPDRYDKVLRHDHLICPKCGRISDFYMDDITGLIEAKLGDRILSYDLKCSCVCNECRKMKTFSA